MNTKIVRRLNRRAAFWRVVDEYSGWAIALCFVALYGCIRGIAGS